MEKFNFNLLKVDQLGFVFKDIDNQAKVMEKLYNLPPFLGWPEVEFPTKYKGKDAILKARALFSKMGDPQSEVGEPQVELIQWIEGESPYKDYLEQGREGLHHLGMHVDDLDPYLKDFESKGIEILFYGEIGEGRFAYMDTESTFGIIVELIQRS